MSHSGGWRSKSWQHSNGGNRRPGIGVWDGRGGGEGWGELTLRRTCVGGKAEQS